MVSITKLWDKHFPQGAIWLMSVRTAAGSQIGPFPMQLCEHDQTRPREATPSVGLRPRHT
jgi:hypothetical protein